MAAAETRMYHARHYDPQGRVVRERVIEATTRAAARAHASATSISVELLTSEAALRLGADGVKTEVAGAPIDPDKGVHPDQQSLGVEDQQP